MNILLQCNLASKHAKLFPLDTAGANKDTQQAQSLNFGPVFSPRDSSTTILEENSQQSENLSNLGQGPSPLKHPAQHINAMVSNFANVFKTMTPLPKLNQNFSAMPSSRSSKADLGNEQMQTE